MKKLLLSLFVLVLIAEAAIAQTVTGTVTGQSDGLPLPGVSINIKGSAMGTSSDNNGRFTIQAQVGETLVFQYIGFEKQEAVVPQNYQLNVVLLESAQSLDDVVITAGGVSIQRRQQGNQSTTIGSESLTQAKAFNVAQSLSGKVAGLQVNAVGGGVNPDIRLVLRGNRSLLGNNQALVVVDNVIVPTSVLGNLNPEDIEDITVLNGAGAASLYGSDASNGALIITTKRGKDGVSTITVGHTTTLENVSFTPKLQNRFGSGTGPDDIPSYTAYENQQYGPAFDGSMVVIGKPTENGNIQTIPYSPTDARDQFWDNGLTNQTDLSMSSGDEKGSYYFSSQYLDQKSTVPGDKYNRFTIRVNGERKIKENFTFNFNTNYVQNRYDLSTELATAYNDVLQSPAHIPLTNYSNWKSDEFANPNGYFNEYYDNPYFTLDNNRSQTRNDYLTGSTQFKWFPIEPLSFMFRVSLATRNVSSKAWSNRFDYSEYTVGISGSSKQAGEFPGGVVENSFFETQLNPEFQAQYKEQLSDDFSIDAILGASARDNNTKGILASSFGMAQPDLFNIANTTQRTEGGESISRIRQVGVYGDVRLGYRSYLYLHVTGRNDWRSQLAPENRSFFYPSADISFIASDAFPEIKNSGVIDVLKLRGNVSKVGLVNIGAYALLPTFGQAFGYPYSGVVGYTLGDRIVADNLNPEITKSFEGGLDFELFQSRVVGSFTAYKSSTTDQTLPVNLTPSTGYTSYLTNTGEVTNNGFETMLRVTPIRTSRGLEVTLGANYTYNDNKVISLFEGAEELFLGSWGPAGVYAVPGKGFPMLKGTRYERDDQDRVIVDAITGFPTVTTEYYELGRTEPIHRLGLDGVVTYKGLRFATIWEYRAGHSMFNQSTTGLDFSGAGVKSTFFNRERFVVPNSVIQTGTNSDGTPVYSPNTNITTYTGGVDFWTNGPSNTGVAENYIYSAAFWKLREASISYDLPAELFRTMPYVKGVRVSLQGRNLLLWVPGTNLYTDPEYSAFDSDSNAIGITGLNDPPPARYYGFSLQVTL